MEREFIRTLRSYYVQHGRHDLPWRQSEPNGKFDAYKVLVSEIMLQQTQVPRVIPKYHQFLQQFPAVTSLAVSPLSQVLVAWQGLGYNRRAKFLWQAARQVATEYKGEIPQAVGELIRLPGVGRNTAGAIAAYAFNQPAVFIETNIRTVFIHHFFAGETQVPDNAIQALLVGTLAAYVQEGDTPRTFYWALMDYGTHLKQTIGNIGQASKSYAKQSAFHGSVRQLRGIVLRGLSTGPKHRTELHKLLSDQRAEAVLQGLEQEGFIIQQQGTYRLAD